jgi:hypothetical protein
MQTWPPEAQGSRFQEAPIVRQDNTRVVLPSAGRTKNMDGFYKNKEFRSPYAGARRIWEECGRHETDELQTYVKMVGGTLEALLEDTGVKRLVDLTTKKERTELVSQE